MSNAGPLSPLTVGGIKHALIGSLEMITIALAITIPLGLTCAVYLNETRGRLVRFVRTIVEAMTALPSIVAGLFIYATWILTLHREKSAFAAGLAISVMMLPIIIRASDVVLRLVPANLREASAALGAPSWRTVWHVVLPTARSGLATAVILGTARGIGETSPVLLTAGFTASLNTNPLHGPNISLPLAVFEFVQSPQPAMIARGFACAAFLMLVVLALFIVARVLGGRGPGVVTPRQARRIRHGSARDLRRFEASGAQASPSTSPDQVSRFAPTWNAIPGNGGQMSGSAP
jgi:phosphate transport system permease protein